MRIWRVGGALAAVAMASTPGVAWAATTVSYSAPTGVLIQGDAGVNTAQPSLTGDVVTVRLFTNNKITPEPLTAGPGCGLANGQVTCTVPSGGVTVLTFRGGDGPDILAGGAYRGDQFASGEGGNDSLTGGLGFDALDGGPGNDHLSGGPGNDSLKGGTGDDILQDDLGDDTYDGGDGDDTFVVDDVPAGADTYIGGGGHDTITYAARTTPVRLDFASAASGLVGRPGFPGSSTTPAEGDAVHDDVEHYIGGSGDDAFVFEPISGARAGWTFDGGPGNDVLNGSRSFGFTLIGGTGNDTFLGGIGPDHLELRDGEQDTILSCGNSTDSVVADLHDTSIPTNCEIVDKDAVREGPNVRVLTRAARVDRSGHVPVSLRCPAVLGRLGCHGTLAVRLDGAAGRGGPRTHYDIQAGRARTVTATLSPGDLRALGRASQPRLRLTSIERGRHGPKTAIRVLAVR